MTVGFDVLAKLDGEHRYSGTYRHPMVNFDFTVSLHLNFIIIATILQFDLTHISIQNRSPLTRIRGMCWSEEF